MRGARGRLGILHSPLTLSLSQGERGAYGPNCLKVSRAMTSRWISLVPS